MRRFGLFGATVLLPCALLVVFGYRMVRQDGELAARHAESEQRARVQQQQQARLAALEKLKRAAVEDFFAGRKLSVAFAALVSDRQIDSPWTQSLPDRSAWAVCEAAEFAPGRTAEAIACYGRMLVAGRDEAQFAYTRLLLGRALVRAGEMEKAKRENLALLSTAFSLRDDQGVPFAFYAADRLLHDPSQVSTVAQRFGRERPEDLPALSPPAAYLLQSIADRLDEPTWKRTAAAAVPFAAHVETLRADLPGLLPVLRREGSEPVWETHGDWLIGLAKAPESGKELLVAVVSLAIEVPALPATPFPAPRTGIYMASLGLVCILAISGACLLWRDMQRDLAVSSLRSQFVSSVSHELKTPLTSIRMFAETLRMRPDGDPVMRTEYLDTIVSESERLSRLVDNVLDLSRIEQGRKLYHFQPTSVAAVIDSVVRAAGYPLRQAGFELCVTGDESLPAVAADADAVQQAVLNLLTNAMKYSAGRKQIDLAVRRDGDAVVIAVRDYGIGIPAEHRQRIFERFYRVPSLENQGVPGAGLGLTVVAHIAQAHGGEVIVESQPGAGSSFSLRLPLNRPGVTA
jgi:signal transduction histidine kinase